MKLFKVTPLFVLPLLTPVLLAGCGGGGETASTDSPVAAKPGKAKVEAGKVETFKEVGLQFTVPAGWKLEVDNDKVVPGRKIASPDGEAEMTLMLSSKEAAGPMLAAMRKQGKKNVTNYKVEPEKTETINGMKYKFVTHTGDVPGGSVIVTTGSIEAKKPVVLMFGMDKKDKETVSPILDGILKSMKKM